MKTFNIAFFASHGGSNMQAIIDEIEKGRLKSKPALVISNNSKSGSAERARNHNIPFYHISTITYPDEVERTEFIKSLFAEYEINLVVLAGYMKKLPVEIITLVGGRVLNIHPALLPKFGGEGMYGMNVHKAVVESDENYSGATVHLVDSEYDRGKILLQRSIDIFVHDTPESLAERVLKIEHEIYPEVIEMLEKEIIKI
jgi:phosphoribosylglycinamide formyltransferase 1